MLNACLLAAVAPSSSSSVSIMPGDSTCTPTCVASSSRPSVAASWGKAALVAPAEYSIDSMGMGRAGEVWCEWQAKGCEFAGLC
jgi:hypothetical protein